MMNFDEEMNAGFVVTQQDVVETKTKEQSFRKTAAVSGILLLCIVAATTSFGGFPMPSAGRSSLFDRQLFLKGIFGGSYSASDVAAHSSRNDCWSIIFDSVYDLTNFVGRHSGGSGKITAICGRDGTSSYRNAHGSSVKGDLRKYRKGSLA